MRILIDIFTYAFRGSGKYVLLVCVVLSVVAKLAGIAPLLGAVAVVLLSGYFCAVFFQLVQSSATGGSEAPDFPDTANVFEDMIWPMLQVLVVGLVSFGPAGAYVYLVEEKSLIPFIGYGLLALGAAYFPMALLAVVVLGYTGALSPHIVVPALFRGGWIYWTGVGVLCSLYGLERIVDNMFSGSFIVGPLILSILGSYTLMTNARTLGIVYRERREELGWL